MACRHYENMPMQYTAIFTAVKMTNISTKKLDIFLIFAQNIDRGYTTEAVLTSTYIKVGCKGLNITWTC